MLFEIWVERSGPRGRCMVRHGKRLDVKVDRYLYKVPMAQGLSKRAPGIHLQRRSWDLFQSALEEALRTYAFVGSLQSAANTIWHEGNPHSLYAFHTLVRLPWKKGQRPEGDDGDGGIFTPPLLQRLVILPPLTLLKRLSAQTICTVPGGLDACDCLVYTPLGVGTRQKNARIVTIEISHSTPLFRLVALHRSDGALGPLRAVLDDDHLVTLDRLLEEGKA